MKTKYPHRLRHELPCGAIVETLAIFARGPRLGTMTLEGIYCSVGGIYCWTRPESQAEGQGIKQTPSSIIGDNIEPFNILLKLRAMKLLNSSPTKCVI